MSTDEGRLTRLEIEGIEVGAGELFTARSFFFDRIVPACEHVLLPPVTVPGGTVEIRDGDITAAAPAASRLRKFVPQVGQTVPEGRWFIDMRVHEPRNWAHFLNDYLPLFFRICEMTKRDPARACLVLPKASPSFLKGAADLFGLEVMLTAGAVSGDGVIFRSTPWICLRAARTEWARLPVPKSAIAAALKGAPPGPRKLFLARRDTRKISNMAEIEPFLQKKGFQTVYPETLPPADQMRLFHDAEEVVAVHGAGLAPMIYAPPGKRLIEILPCGHMTNVFRVMAARVGWDWIGVRGRIKPEYVKPAYDLDSSFKAFSLDAFEVDPVSLDMAFDRITRRAAGHLP